MQASVRCWSKVDARPVRIGPEEVVATATSATNEVIARRARIATRMHAGIARRVAPTVRKAVLIGPRDETIDPVRIGRRVSLAKRGRRVRRSPV